jgi:hypothetical protein
VSEALAIHPAAEIFPLMDDEEMAGLAADIKDNGLRSPIILDAEGRVVDGRCRLAACKLAGVEPTFTSLNGDDPLTVVVSLNVHRRNLTKGQLAIAAREAWPLYEVGQGTRTDTSGKTSQKWTREELSERFHVSDKSIQQARALENDLADVVKSGERSLADAYAEHQRRVDEKKRKDALPEDLAERVHAERLDLEQAEAIEAERRERIGAFVSEVRRVLSVLSGMAGHPVPEEFQQALTEQEREALMAVLRVIPKGVGL